MDWLQSWYVGKLCHSALSELGINYLRRVLWGQFLLSTQSSPLSPSIVVPMSLQVSVKGHSKPCGSDSVSSWAMEKQGLCTLSNHDPGLSLQWCIRREYWVVIPSRGNSLSAGSLWEVNAAMLPRELCAQPSMGEPKVRTGPQAPPGSIAWPPDAPAHWYQTGNCSINEIYAFLSTPMDLCKCISYIQSKQFCIWSFL